MADRSGLMQAGFFVLAIWMITADPVEQLLPVPMPELVAGTDTTRIAGVTLRDGVPDYPSVLDARDHERLTGPGNVLGAIVAAVGTARWSAAQRTLIEPWLLGRKPLAPAPILLKQSNPAESGEPAAELKTLTDRFDTTTDHAAWLVACAPGLEALHAVPNPGILALPAALSMETNDPLQVDAGFHLLMGLLNLGQAAVVQAKTAAGHGDLDGVGKAGGLAQRIAGWLVDSRHPQIYAHAIALEVALREVWLAALAVPSEASIQTVTGWAARLPPDHDPRPAMMEGARLIAAFTTAQHCAQFRTHAPATDRAKSIRRNAPPDPNRALAEVQQFCDLGDPVIAGASDVRALAAIDPRRLPLPLTIVEAAFDQRPLAERIIFRQPAAERQAFMARRFAAVAILVLSQQHQRALSRARALVRRDAAVAVALAILAHQGRTGALPKGVDELPEGLRPLFASGDTAITLTCADGTCTITTAGDRPVTLWRFPPQPPATIP